MDPLEQMLATIASPPDPMREKIRAAGSYDEARTAAGQEPDVGGLPSIDWSKIGDFTLQSKLQALDARFPPGLRHDRPYTAEETQYRNPTRQLSGEYGDYKGKRPLMRNPITGAPVPASPYITPHMLAAAANTLVEAKARARAEIMRGRETEDAAVEALSHAFGVDPSMVKGMPLDLAGKVIPAVSQRQRFDETTKKKELEAKLQRSEQQTAMERLDPNAAASTTGMSDASDAWQVFGAARSIKGQQDKEAALQQKADLAEQNKNKLAGVMSELQDMDPVEAARQAPQRLAQFMDQRGAAYATLVGQFDTRAQQYQVAQAKEQQRAQADQQKEQQRAQKDFEVRIVKPLDTVIGAKPKSVKKPSEKSGLAGAGAGEDAYDVNYHPAILDQMSALRVLAGNAREAIPNFDDLFASAVEMAKSRVPGDRFPDWMNDPKSALEGTGPIDDKDPAKTHAALVMIGLALRALLSGAGNAAAR